MQKDDQGYYVPGYRFAPNCGEGFSDFKIRSCPIANANRMATVIQAYQRSKRDLCKISDYYPHPSCALIDACDILDTHTEALKIRQQEERLKNGN